MVIGILICIALAIYIIAFQSAIDNTAVILPLGLIAILLWGLNTYANPNKLRCMQVVKGQMTFNELKERVGAEEFVEPLCLWDFSKGQKSNMRMLVSENWLLLGTSLDDPKCIPKRKIKTVRDTCLSRTVEGWSMQEAHFIDFTLDDGKTIDMVVAREEDVEIEALLREAFPDADAMAVS